MKRTTIHEVARRAGVSVMTVSRVVNKAANVRPETRERVMAAVQELRFQPSAVARNVRTRRTQWIALPYHGPPSDVHLGMASYFVDLQAGIISRCKQDNYHVAFQPCAANSVLADVLGTATQWRPDGVLLSPPLCFWTGLLAELRRLRIPFVRIAPEDFSDPSPCVHMDDRAAARQMTEYLIGLGHRRIGFIQGHPDHVASRHRYEGFLAALQAAGIEARTSDVVQGFFTLESGAKAAQQLLRRKTRPSAIFASNDEMAAGCLAVAHEAGIQVPAELSIAGFDDSPLAGVIWPPLTTVRQPIYDMAFAATHQLLTLIQQGSASQRITLSYRLIERESTAPASVSDKQRARNTPAR